MSGAATGARARDLRPGLTLLEGDCVAVMAGMEPGSVDAIVCDPPYGLEFMGKEWDRIDTRQPGDAAYVTADNPYGRSKVRHGAAASYGASSGAAQQEWHLRWASEALRVLKPGGHLLAFGGTRTVHRMACAIEDAGFEVRDMLVWGYAQGFPKSLDVSKAIDRAAGAKREVVGTKMGLPGYSLADTPQRGVAMAGNVDGSLRNAEAEVAVTAPATPEAERWSGWGTALKPAFEPVVMARRPLVGTVAQNVLRHGTGALNIDGCRVPMTGDDRKVGGFGSGKVGMAQTGTGDRVAAGVEWVERDDGRWPANVVLTDPILDGGWEGVVGGGKQSGGGNPRWRSDEAAARSYGGYAGGDTGLTPFDTAGTYSRFFLIPKAGVAEREPDAADAAAERLAGEGRANDHPTVKPVALMRHLVRLVTPPGGLVLDPFNGSGTTGIAAMLEGMRYVGIEREAHYLAITRARLATWQAEAERSEAERGQTTLWEV